jgi:hypothetical protein
VRKFNFLAGGLVTATVLAGLGVNAAGAAPKINTESGESCLVKVNDKLSVAYPPGSKMTIKMSDGSTETYTCDGNTGNWVKTSRLVPTKVVSIKGEPVMRTVR